MDEPAENLWTHGGHPYDAYTPINPNGEFWGLSLVELLISPQRCINRILAAMQHNVELTGNPLWLDEDKNLRRTPISNRPGQRVPISSGDSRTGWLNPPPLNQGAANMVDFLLKRMEIVAGLNAIIKGQTPGGRNSQGVIDSITESSHVSIRAMLRELEYAMRGAGEKKAGLITENYTTPRIISVAGPNGERTSKALKGRHFMIPGRNGAIPLKYQLLVDAGSRHHVSRQMRENRAVQLFTLGLIDEQAALCEIDFPNYTEVAARVQQQKAQAMAANPTGRTAARA
jgi:hypothetical protein